MVLAYVLLLPMLVLMTGLVCYPVLETLSYSLRSMKLTEPEKSGFVGLAHYVEILRSQGFRYSLVNTGYILVIVTGLTTAGAVFAALLLNRDTRLSGVLTAAAIIPWALPPVVNGILWRFIFHPGYGFMNKLLMGLQLTHQPVSWLSSRFLLLTVVSIVAAWRMIPFFAVILLSGMKTIPEELYEAAAMDGGKAFSCFYSITLPLTLPFAGIGLTHTLIMSVNIFDEIVALSGFNDIAKNLLVEDYLVTFSFLDFGKGSALAYLIMVLSGVLGFVYIRSVNREVEY